MALPDEYEEWLKDNQGKLDDFTEKGKAIVAEKAKAAKKVAKRVTTIEEAEAAELAFLEEIDEPTSAFPPFPDSPREMLLPRELSMTPVRELPNSDLELVPRFPRKG